MAPLGWTNPDKREFSPLVSWICTCVPDRKDLPWRAALTAIPCRQALGSPAAGQPRLFPAPAAGPQVAFTHSCVRKTENRSVAAEMGKGVGAWARLLLSLPSLVFSPLRTVCVGPFPERPAFSLSVLSVPWTQNRSPIEGPGPLLGTFQSPPPSPSVGLLILSFSSAWRQPLVAFHELVFIPALHPSPLVFASSCFTNVYGVFKGTVD